MAFPKNIEIKVFEELRDDKSGMNVVLDIGSNRILEVDDLTLLVLCLGRSYGSETLRTLGLRAGYARDDVEKSIEIVTELIEKGIIREAFPKIQGNNKDIVIDFITLNLSHACNLACRYCFAQGGNYGGRAEFMSIKVAKAAIDFLKGQKSARNSLALFGGEPLMNLETLRFVLEYSRRLFGQDQLRISITTNGLGLNEETITLLKEHNVDILFSIDGGPATHNYLRPRLGGGDSYADIVQAFKLLKEMGKECVARSTITSVEPDVHKIVSSLDSIGFSSFNLQPIHGCTDLKMDPEKEKVFIDSFESLVSEKNYERITYVRLVLDRVKSGTRVTHYCSMGTRGVVVTPTGDVYPCHRLVGNDQFIVGNILKSIDFEKIRSIGERLNVDMFPQCSTCWARYFCGGGCYAENLVESGSFFRPFSLRCKLFRRLLERVISFHVDRVRRAMSEDPSEGGVKIC